MRIKKTGIIDISLYFPYRTVTEKIVKNFNNNRIAKLDTTGLLCPLPVLKIQKAIKSLTRGDILEVISDDPVATIDIPNYCRESGHKLLNQVENNHSKFLIQKN